jgi:hypothetical protein
MVGEIMKNEKMIKKERNENKEREMKKDKKGAWGSFLLIFDFSQFIV